MKKLTYLLWEVQNHKLQIIHLINAQYMLRFANNPWYFEEKLLDTNIDSEEVQYQLKLVDEEGLEIIVEFFNKVANH